MGSSHTTLNAAETGGMMDSIRNLLPGSPPATPPATDGGSGDSTINTGDDGGGSLEKQFAASTGIFPGSSPATPPVGAAGTQAEDPNKIESTLTTFPGTWPEIHKAKEVFPAPFDGVKLVFNKGLSRHFQATHNFTLGTTQPSGYKFGATYVGTKQLSQTEQFPILLGEIDPSGNLSAQCIHAFSTNTRSRLVAQYKGPSVQALEMSTDYRGEKTTASLTFANPDFLSGTGIIVAHYLQAVTPRVALGAELLLHRGMNPHLGRVSRQASTSFAVRYSTDTYNAAIQLAPQELGLHASYYHKLTEHMALGVELEGKRSTKECQATVGYSFEIPAAESVIKAQMDTNLNIATVIEKKMTPLPFTLSMSMQANQKKAQYLCGIGISTG